MLATHLLSHNLLRGCDSCTLTLLRWLLRSFVGTLQAALTSGTSKERRMGGMRGLQRTQLAVLLLAMI